MIRNPAFSGALLVPLCVISNLCPAEIKKSVEAIDSTEEQTTAECQSLEEESKVGAAAASEENSAVLHGQDVPKESTSTSSPDTDSPVMINVDVSPRVKVKFNSTTVYPYLYLKLPLKLKHHCSCVKCILLILFMVLMQEMGSGNTSQKSDEEDFVKVEDLPLQLTVMCEVCNSSQIKKLM